MSESYRESGAEDRSVLVVAFNQRVFGLSPKDGSVLWEQRCEGYGVIEVQIAHGRIFAATSSHLSAYEYPSGRPLGAVVIPDQYKGRPSMVLERDRIFLGSNGEVTCFGLDGKPLWVQSFQGKGLARVTLGFPGNVRQADDVGSK